MTAQRGRDILLKLEDQNNVGSFITVGGLRSTELTMNAATVDVTTIESAGWRHLLGEAGLRDMRLSGGGVFLANAASRQIRAAFFAAEVLNWQLIIPGLGQVTGPFQITRLEYGGTHDGEMTVSVTLASAGNITFTEG